jgi:hypothetical protein
VALRHHGAEGVPHGDGHTVGVPAEDEGEPGAEAAVVAAAHWDTAPVSASAESTCVHVFPLAIREIVLPETP